MIPRDHPLASRVLSLVPINGLDHRLQEQVLARGEMLEFKRRRTVFEAGARDPYTFYLLDGELELQAESASPVRMQAGDENSRRALAQLQPRRYTAVATSQVTVFRIERAVLDHILADEQTLDGGVEVEIREIDEDEEEDGDWMTRLLSSALFTRLPHDNIQRFFTELEPVQLESGDTVIEQGSEGDYLYIIAEGRCAVVRRTPGAAQEVQLAVLKEGDTFGEDSLVSNSPRNATVRMVTDGMLMRLGKSAFLELVGNPTLKAMPWSEACKLAEQGATWLDVRFADEHRSNAIEGSENIPLNALRLHAAKLDPDKHYIVYCDTGARSSAGAFLLARLGFDACYLAGGLERSPLSQGRAAGGGAEAPAAKPAPAGFEFEFTDGSAAAAAPDAAARPAAARAAPPPAPARVPREAAADAARTAATASPAAGPGAGAAAPEAPAPPAAPAAPAPTAADIARARQMLLQLRHERDQAAAFGKKAADAARELKSRNDQLAQAIAGERSRREQLEKELGAARSDAERAESMERSRLSGELEKVSKRLEALQAERGEEQDKAAAEIERLRTQAAETEDRLRALTQEVEQARAERAAADVEFQEALREAREDAAGQRAGVARLEQELGEARERLAEAERRSRDAAASRESHDAALASAVHEAEERVAAETKRLEDERARVAAELDAARNEREQADAQLREQRAELERALAEQRGRAEELDRREMDLSAARDAADAELEQRELALTRREEKLSADEEALGGEKSAWKDTVEKAIAEERERLAIEYARYREESDATLEERVQALVEERIEARLDALRAEHAAREGQMRTQVEAHVSKMLTEFDARLAQVRSSYETQLSEQETMLEDERRRLETEVVRLREALGDARQAAGRQPVPQMAPTAQEGEPADDLTVELDRALGEPPPAAAAPTAAPSAPPAPPLDLDLDIDDSELRPAPVAHTVAAPEPEAKPAPPVPVIEVPEEPGAPGEPPPAGPGEKRQRVITTSQLAEIRQRMQEKMRAAKAKAG